MVQVRVRVSVRVRIRVKMRIVVHKKCLDRLLLPKQSSYIYFFKRDNFI